MKRFLSGIGVIGMSFGCTGSLGFAENNFFVGFENECKMRHMRSDTKETRKILFNMVESGKNKVLVDNVIKRLTVDKDGYFWYKDLGGSARLDVQLQFYDTIRIVSGPFPNNGGRAHLYGDYGDWNVSSEREYPALYNLCNEWREEKIAGLDAERAKFARNISNPVLTKYAANFLIYYILVDLVDKVNRGERVTTVSSDL